MADQIQYPSQSLSVPQVQFNSQAWHLEIPLYIYATVFASLCVVTGLIWDISWHMSIGRDGLFSPPHNVIYLGAVISGLFSGYQVLKVSFWGNAAEKAQNINFWGIFYGSLGNLLSIWGALAMLTSAPFDDWWHNTYGLDVTILSPPHTVLALGIITLQLGTMIGVLSLQNREKNHTISAFSQRRAKRIETFFLVSAGFALTMIYLLASENLDRWTMHHSSFYQISGAIFPIILVAVASATAHRWAATMVALTYTLVMCGMLWLLPLFPAKPLLGPIYNFIEHYQPYHFPILLLAPALAIDLTLRRFGKFNHWLLALIVALSFVISLLVVQYPFGDFLMTPLARTWVFGQSAWYFGSPPDWEYRFQFFPWMSESLSAFASGMGIALVLAYVSVRIGLWWGNWMQKVQR